MHKIGIIDYGIVSPWGFGKKAQQSGFLGLQERIFREKFSSGIFPVGKYKGPELEALLHNHPKYIQSDRLVHLSLLAASELRDTLKNISSRTVINMGTSRGATHSWEKSYHEFLKSGKAPVKASPHTTFGNLSSRVAHFLQSDLISIDHSVTCGSGLMSIMNAVAWLGSGMAEHFLAGGAEAPLTDFTLSQMRSLGIYSMMESSPFCRPFGNTNSMVLGEAAAIFLLEKYQPGIHYKAVITGIGVSQEFESSLTGISAEGKAFQQSMQQALDRADRPHIDKIFMHAPGTTNGDHAELHAVHAVFGEKIPQYISNKQWIGHTLGASGLVSLANAINHLNENPSHQSALVNAMGFGGNAFSVVLST